MSDASAALAGWMPLRLVAIAPLAGQNTNRPAGLLRVTPEGFAELFATIQPKLTLKIVDPAAAAGAAPGLIVELTFAALADFEPMALVARLPQLAARKAARDADAAQAADIDAGLTRALDSLIHSPAFLELEAAWRGLHFLATRGQAGAGAEAVLALDLLVIGPGEDYTGRFRTDIFDPDYEDKVEVPLAAVLADSLFDHQPVLLDRLARMGDLCRVLQVAFIGSVGAGFFGLKNLAHVPAMPDLVTRSVGGAYAAWNKFQATDAARWVSLAVNRFLLRTPHGEGVEAPADGAYLYRETVDVAHPEWHCWGSPIWAAGVSLAGSYAEHGHTAAGDGLSGTGAHHDLPTRVTLDGNKQLHLCTEVVVADEKAWEMARSGLTPLIGMKDGPIAYFPFLGNAYRVRLGSITLDQSLVYQLYAGQLGHTVLKLAGRVPAGDPVAGAQFLEQSIFAALSPFVGDAPGERVKVTPTAQPDGSMVAAIHVSPTFKIQDKELSFDLGLPLG